MIRFDVTYYLALHNFLAFRRNRGRQECFTVGEAAYLFHCAAPGGWVFGQTTPTEHSSRVTHVVEEGGCAAGAAGVVLKLRMPSLSGHWSHVLWRAELCFHRMDLWPTASRSFLLCERLLRNIFPILLTSLSPSQRTSFPQYCYIPVRGRLGWNTIGIYRVWYRNAYYYKYA